jgi:hypothetical protein
VGWLGTGSGIISWLANFAKENAANTATVSEPEMQPWRVVAGLWRLVTFSPVKNGVPPYLFSDKRQLQCCSLGSSCRVPASRLNNQWQAKSCSSDHVTPNHPPRPKIRRELVSWTNEALLFEIQLLHHDGRRIPNRLRPYPRQ